MKYPINCITDLDKLECLEIAEERLRLQHNKMGKWYTSGLTQNEYNSLPVRIRIKYPDSLKLSESNFRNYQKTIHHRKLMRLKDMSQLIARNDFDFKRIAGSRDQFFSMTKDMKKSKRWAILPEDI